MKSQKYPPLFTIGHSTHSIEELVYLLKAHGIKNLIDIRTIPKSRHNPQFNGENLAPSLRNRRINYRHMKSLGGLRHTNANSPNKGWKNKSFRGYADYMLTPEFATAIDKLQSLSRRGPTAIMCAEAVPWRCHRSLVADYLTLHGQTVKHIMSKTLAKPHTLSAMAIEHNGTLIYPKKPELTIKL